MDVQHVIELMETIADYKAHLASYKKYIKEHPSCRFRWEKKIATMEKSIALLESKFQLASFNL